MEQPIERSFVSSISTNLKRMENCGFDSNLNFSFRELAQETDFKLMDFFELLNETDSKDPIVADQRNFVDKSFQRYKARAVASIV